MPDKCEYCEAKPEFIALVENDEFPHRNESIWLCSEHMATSGRAIIDSWTIAEWLSEE